MVRISPALLLTASVGLYVSNLVLAQPHGARSLDSARIDSLTKIAAQHLSTSDFQAYALANQALTDAYVIGGDFESAVRIYHEAGDICRVHGLYKWYGLFNKNAAEIDFMKGRIQAARTLLGQLSDTTMIPDKEMAAIRFRLGDLECDLGNYDQGIELLESSLQLALRAEYVAILGSIYTELGLCQNISDSKVRSIDNLIKAIPYLDDPKHSRVLGHNYLVLSELFEQIGQEDKALEYLARGVEIARNNSYQKLYHRGLYLDGRRRIANRDATGIAKLDSARTYYARNGLNHLAAMMALDIASAHIQGKSQELAHDFLVNAEEELEGIDDPLQKAKYYEHLCRYHILTGNVSSARSAFRHNRAIADSIGGTLLTQRSLALEVDVLQAENKFREALLANYRYHEFKDSVNTLAQNRILFDTEAKYQKQENEKAIILLQTQNQVKDLQIQRASRSNLMLLLGLIALIVIVGIGIYSIGLKQRTNKQLGSKNAIISKSLAEKDLLLREIHHRVKNNLEVISSLLYLQSKYVEDENVLEAIREGQNRVRSMGLIHKNLYQDDNLTGVRMDEYLDKLIETLLKSYKVGDNEIDLRKSIEPLNLDVDTVIPLALIVNELISNALKYAICEGGETMLSVALKQEDSKLVLSVSDNGPGMPETFDIEDATSLGYKLIDLFTKKLNGSLEIFNEGGTNVVVQFSKFNIV